jgi:hypothetical protein
MLFIPDLYLLLRPPYIFLILGVISLSAGVVSTCTGKTWMRYHGSLLRAENPKLFWQNVAAYYLVGVCFIAYFLYKVHEL